MQRGTLAWAASHGRGLYVRGVGKEGCARSQSRIEDDALVELVANLLCFKAAELKSHFQVSKIVDGRDVNTEKLRRSQGYVDGVTDDVL